MIKYQVTVKKLYTVTLDDIEANSDIEACEIAELEAEEEYCDENMEISSTCFPQEEEKVFVASYSKPTRDIGDPCEPPYVIIYDVKSNHEIDRGEQYDNDPYYQLRYFTRGAATRPYGELFYIEEYPYKDEDFVREAAQNWASGIKKLDLDYSLAKNKKNMVDTHLGNGYGSYGRLK